MSNLNSWEDDLQQDENLAQQTGQMNLGNNQGQQRGGYGGASFTPGAASFTPGAAHFQPGQQYGGNNMPQGQYYGGQGYQYGGQQQQQQQYGQYGQSNYNSIYGQGQQYGMPPLLTLGLIFSTNSFQVNTLVAIHNPNGNNSNITNKTSSKLLEPPLLRTLKNPRMLLSLRQIPLRSQW